MLDFFRRILNRCFLFISFYFLKKSLRLINNTQFAESQLRKLCWSAQFSYLFPVFKVYFDMWKNRYWRVNESKFRTFNSSGPQTTMNWCLIPLLLLKELFLLVKSIDSFIQPLDVMTEYRYYVTVLKFWLLLI